ncbi:MAG: nickel pincer cofactor biosynthesis protein LarB [Treponema sp.]|nr:nickel pincer cofactor biosynthesis protein LarB [Treponema sp.]
MDIKQILENYKNGLINIEESEKLLSRPPLEDIGYACIDHNRELRTGNSEIIYGEGKNAQQILGIIKKMIEKGAKNILASRCNDEKFQVIKQVYSNAKYYSASRTITIINEEIEKIKEKLLIISAGTSDIPIAEEAQITANFLGLNVETLNDVGVAGIHRLLSKIDIIQNASCIIVIAGMEGALPSVVGGLVDVPVIAVPTSVGYGSSFGGLSALLGMLNSCASGLAVVNIDNGFGAAYLAKRILKRK